jgi:hypothetical protein
LGLGIGWLAAFPFLALGVFALGVFALGVFALVLVAQGPVVHQDQRTSPDEHKTAEHLAE